MGFNPGGGSSSVGGASDVTLNSPTDGQVLTYDSSLQKWKNASGATADATTSSVGVVQLAGDLAGTAAAPLVAKVNGITLPGGSPTTGQVLTATSTTATSWSTPAAGAGNATTGSVGVIQLAGDLAGTATSPTVPGLAAVAPLANPTFTGTVTVPTPVNATDASTKAYVDTQITDGATPDATTGAKGVIQLAGDLAGTAATPTVAKVNGITLSGTPSTGQVMTASSTTAAAWATPISGSQALAATAVKTTTYTAAVGDLVPADATSAAFTVTLPTAPADKSRALIKKIDSSANVVTISAGGSDVFNKASGSTSLTLSLQNQSVSVQYAASTSIWYVVGDDLPLGQLDGRYVGTSTQSVLLPLSNGSDDTAAVNAAIAASPSFSLIVGRPGQTYIAGSGPFQFLGNRSYSMYGVTMRPKNAGNYDAVVASPAALTTGSGNNYDGPIQIRGLTVNGNVANQTGGTGCGILLASGSNTSVGSTLLQDCLVYGTRSTGICLTEVNLDGNGLVAGTASPYTGESRIVGCRVYNAGANGIWQRGGGLGGGAAMTDGFCLNCIVGYATHDGIRVDSSGGWQLSGNHVYGTGLSGILVSGSFSTRITENYVEGIGVLDSAAAHTSTSSAFTQAPAWDGSTAFVFNQAVTYSGVIYKSKIDSNAGNQPDTSTTQWGSYAGGGSVAAIASLTSNSARPVTISTNQTSLGHNSWGLNANFLYRGILVQGPATGTSKATAFILANDIANELQPAGTNTTSVRLASAGSGPSGINSYERDNAIRGSWFSQRSVDTSAGPIGAVGAGASGGTGSSVTVTGNNQAGNLSVTSGNSALAAGALVSVSYTGTPAPNPRVVFMPRNALSAGLGPFYATTSTTGFTINTSVAPASNTAYSFDYITMIGA